MDIDEMLQEAIEARDQGNWRKSRDLLLAIESHYQESWVYLAIRGRVEWELGNLSDAIKAFRRATELQPQEESVSVGLFHCLWALGFTDAAFDEMRRFVLAGGKSDNYRQLLAGINQASEANEDKQESD